MVTKDVIRLVVRAVPGISGEMIRRSRFGVDGNVGPFLQHSTVEVRLFGFGGWRHQRCYPTIAKFRSRACSR